MFFRSPWERRTIGTEHPVVDVYAAQINTALAAERSSPRANPKAFLSSWGQASRDFTNAMTPILTPTQSTKFAGVEGKFTQSMANKVAIQYAGKIQGPLQMPPSQVDQLVVAITPPLVSAFDFAKTYGGKDMSQLRLTTRKKAKDQLDSIKKSFNQAQKGVLSPNQMTALGNYKKA